MLNVEDWAEIRRLHRSEGQPIKVIARVMGISKNTVKAALASDGPPPYRRRPSGSIVDAVEPQIRELLRVYPRMSATVIAERIGWTRGITVLKDRIAELRPAYLPVGPASRTSYVAGEIAQCDFWFPEIELPVGFGQMRAARQLPVLTMVTGYSRWLSAVLVPSRAAEDLFAGWWQLIGHQRCGTDQPNCDPQLSDLLAHLGRALQTRGHRWGQLGSINNHMVAWSLIPRSARIAVITEGHSSSQIISKDFLSSSKGGPGSGRLSSRFLIPS